MKKVLVVCAVAVSLLVVVSTMAQQNNVVVVPLGGAIGDATPADVVEGKTFSSKTDKGLVGTRSPGVLGKTGQTLCYDPACTVSPCETVDCAGTGEDGELQKGVAVSPRFTNNGDGTVTDNLTGLIWLRDSNCSYLFSDDDSSQNARPWQKALEAAQKLAAGYCGLSDGSEAGDWRLPNLRELQSLIDFSQYNPALPPGHHFLLNILSLNYWSSTSDAETTYGAWRLSFYNGGVVSANKSSSYNMRPVRGGD